MEPGSSQLEVTSGYQETPFMVMMFRKQNASDSPPSRGSAVSPEGDLRLQVSSYSRDFIRRVSSALGNAPTNGLH